MNRICVLPLALFLSAFTAIGQTSGTAQISGHQPADRMVLRVSPTQADCPAGVLVKQQGIARLLYIRTAPPEEGPAIGLRITLTNSRSVGISGARIIVYGYTNDRAEPAVAFGPVNGKPAGVGKAFDLTLKVNPGGEASTDLWAKGFTGINSVDLDSLTYADGSKWRSADDRRCPIGGSLRAVSPVVSPGR